MAINQLSTEAASTRALDRRELLAWTVVILTGSYLVWQTKMFLSTSLPGARFGFGAFDVLGCAAVLWRLTKAEPRAARPLEVLLLALLCAIGALGPQFAPPAALTVLAGWALTNGDKELQAAGAVLLALASHMLISKIVFAVIAPNVVMMDASLVGEVMKLTVPGSAWHANVITNGHGDSIAVMSGCSSFSNISLGLLGWTALTKLERRDWVRRDVWVAVAVVVVQILCNTARMYLMAQSWPAFLYWHSGGGAQIYAAIASAATVLISVFGARWADKAVAAA